MAKIISAFPACGKTYTFENSQECFNGILDSDSSEFSWIKDKSGNNTKERNPEFPNNYIKHIKDNMDKAEIIFVSSHKEVRDALKANNLEYTLIYPDIDQKSEWMWRFKNRGDDDSFINFISNNWDDFITDMDNEEYPKKVKLPYNYKKYIDVSLLISIMDYKCNSNLQTD